VTRVLVAVFLVAHGLVHAAIYATPKDPAKPGPFDPSHSWALAAGHVAPEPMRSASVGLAWATAALYSLAGVAVLVDAPAWVGFAAVAAVVAIALKGLWFNRWLTFGLALDVAVLVAALGG
jgi:hypothetical protein